MEFDSSTLFGIRKPNTKVGTPNGFMFGIKATDSDQGFSGTYNNNIYTHTELPPWAEICALRDVRLSCGWEYASPEDIKITSAMTPKYFDQGPVSLI